MAKKKGGKSKGFISQGQRPNVKHNVLKAVRRDITPSEKMANVMSAYLAGRNPWVTIANPNNKQTNAKYIRVKAEDLWGSPKNRSYRMAAGATNE
jgi:hypothetical protein